MTQFADHPLRAQLANELHTRPFPVLTAPCRALFLAIKPVENGAARDRAADLSHLIALLDFYGARHPEPGSTHYFGKLGRHMLKWESHTEFVTYTIFAEHITDTPFNPDDFDLFPQDWLNTAPGARVTSAHIRVDLKRGNEEITGSLNEWFVSESVCISNVLDESATIATDFQIDSAGHMRFAVFVSPSCGPNRIGRIVQRICEIEIYKAMSMLGYARARGLMDRLGELDRSVSQLMNDMTEREASSDETLAALLASAAELEKLAAQSAFRFGATGAYAALVQQRIEILREEQFQVRQTFAEFMMRRFDPAMRTVKTTEARISALAERAMRAGELLRTRVEVERSAQTQKLLESMDRRAGLQLRLQHTVEGLSVVAISYYAVNLAIYMLSPIAGSELGFGINKIALTAAVTPLVVFLVWILVRNIRRKTT